MTENEWIDQNYDRIADEISLQMVEDGVAALDWDLVFDARLEKECEKQYHEYLASF
jgi:hypothetical protein